MTTIDLAGVTTGVRILRSSIYGDNEDWVNNLHDWDLSEITWDLLNVLDTYVQCELGGSDEFRDALDAFKRKWLCDWDVRARHTIDEACNRLRTELYENYGV